MFCIIILHLLDQLSSMERGNFKGLEYPEHLISYHVLIEQAPWGGRGRGESQSSKAGLEEPHSLAQTLGLTQPWCPQRALGCKPILTRLSAGKRLI